MCPFCHCIKTTKKGFFFNSSQKKRVQRFFCGVCQKYFSSQTKSLTYYQKKPALNLAMFQLLCSSVSQRRISETLKCNLKTVARRVKTLGKDCSKILSLQTQDLREQDSSVMFDEMETFEHSKCKPLSIAVAVHEKTRKIISLQVASMPAKGHLAEISRKRYGKRKDDRPKALKTLFKDIQEIFCELKHIKSDESPRYPHAVKRAFPNTLHHAYKGLRGCVVGQGELKASGRDPLFSLNHTCAMIRDNLKRLTRRTWCTTKKKTALQDLLNIYAVFHNYRLKHKRKRFSFAGAI